jgi:hypothetical protein
MAAHVLAQTGDSGGAVLGLLLALALLGLQIYLIYAIIATRQDVQAIRQRLLGDTSRTSSTEIQGTGPVTPAARFQSGDVERLREVGELRQSGILTDDEFTRVKEAVLGGWTQGRPDTGPLPHQAMVTPLPEGTHYSVIIQDLGCAEPSRVTKIVRRYVHNFPAGCLQTLPCTVDDEGMGLATAELLAADLNRAGVSANMTKR